MCCSFNVIFKAAYLHNKFWTPNSVEVPDTRCIINEDFVDYHNIIRIPEQISHFKVFWVVKNISGTVCIPGEWNYAYIGILEENPKTKEKEMKGKFFHMVKGDSNGFIEGQDEEWFYYNVIYDDWQNEWLTDNFYIKGTIDLTGDQDLVRENIHQMVPIIDNLNNYRFLNGIKRTQTEQPEKPVLKLPDRNQDAFKTKSERNAYERILINKELEKWCEKVRQNPELGEPDPLKLNIPLIYRFSKHANWKWILLRGLQYHANYGFKVYDVSVESIADPGDAAKFRNILENILHTTELYTLASESNRVYSFARTKSDTKYIEEIDLSGCIDITILHNTHLTKRYTLENPEPKFSLDKFVDTICNRQGWSSSLKPKLRDIFEHEFMDHMGWLVTDISDMENKIFRNATLEKIDRSIINYLDPRGAYKDPEWLQWAETRLVSGKHHRNHIWDNASNPAVMHGVQVNLDELTDEEKEVLRTNYRNAIDQLSTASSRWDLRLIRSGFDSSKFTNLIYLINEYKLVSEDDKVDYLDFSLNDNDDDLNWIALIPDYDRKTHVLSTLIRSRVSSTSPSYLKYDVNKIDTKSTRSTRTKFIQPIIFAEISKLEYEDVKIDWKKPSTDFLVRYKSWGKGIEHPKDYYGKWDIRNRSKYTEFRARGAEILSRGYTFMALQNFVNNSGSAYYLVYQTYYSRMGKYGSGFENYAYNPSIEGDDWLTIYPNYKNNNTNYKDAFGVSPAQRPECVYTSNERKWRRWHTEMTFPVKTDYFNIVDKLREFDDIPDNFLRWEIVNTNIRKGYIGAGVRTFVGQRNPETSIRNDNAPGAYQLTTDEEKKIPPNTVVSIYICLRQSGSPEGDRDFDKVADDNYKKTKKESWSYSMTKLLYWLCRYFFLTKWELHGTWGAIPDCVKVMSTLDEKRYPKNGDGRSQIALSWFKPHNGFWYIAWTRFFAPAIHHAQAFLWTKDKTKFNLQGTNDWFSTCIPNDYDNSGIFPKFYRRRKTNNITDNTLISFLYNGYTPRLKGYTNWTKDDPYTPQDYIGNFTKDYNPSSPYDQPLINRPFIVPENITSIYELFEQLYVSTSRSPLWHGWLGANVQNMEFEKYLENWNNLLLCRYINQTQKYKDNRFDNPSLISKNVQLTTSAGSNRVINIGNLDDDIPPIIAEYLNPEYVLCPIHTWNRTPNIDTDTKRFELYTDKLRYMFKSIVQNFESFHTMMKFEGTNWYASIKLNTKGQQPIWDYELFCDDSSIFKNKQQEKWNFVNHYENDVDVLINTKNELKIFGQVFPLKSRKYWKEGEVGEAGENLQRGEIDIGLYVKPIVDQKQTLAATWYSVSMRFNDQDIIQDIVEVPKEMTKYSGFSNMDREKIIRELGMAGNEYLYQKQMLEFQKQENKFKDKYEYDMNWYQWKYNVIEGALQIPMGIVEAGIGAIELTASLGGLNIAKTAPAWDNQLEKINSKSYRFRQMPTTRTLSQWERIQNTFGEQGIYRTQHYWTPDSAGNAGRPPLTRSQVWMSDDPNSMQNRRLVHYGMRGAHTLTAGLTQTIQGGMNIGKAYDEWYAKDEYRKNMFSLNNQKLMSEGNILNHRHEYHRSRLMESIWEMSANVSYPQLNSSLIYKEYNKERGINDIHIVQHYPSGKLLQYIKNYYKDYGYLLKIPDYECTGITNIKRHLRYEFIYDINHPNSTIATFIRCRATQGVKVVPWIQ